MDPAWPTRFSLAKGRPYAWIPVAVLLIAMLGFWATGPAIAAASPVVLVALNVVFILPPALAVAFLMGRSYWLRGLPGLLWVGSGTLIWGLVGLVAAIATTGDLNIAPTIHNSGNGVAAICHLLGVVLALKSHGSASSGSRWLPLLGGYGAALAAVAGLTCAAAGGRMPVFFVQGVGGTPTRHVVLFFGMLLFVLTALLLRAGRQTRESAFADWYSLAMWLLAEALLAISLQPRVGSPLFWTGRAAEYLGGAYMLAAALAARRARGWEVSLAYALRESEERLRLILETSRIGLWSVDLRTREWSSTPFHNAILGLPGDTPAREQDFVQLLHPDDVKRWEKAREQSVRNALPLELEYRIRRRDGEERWVFTSGRALRDASGVPVQLVGISMDVTARKQAGEALRQSEEKYRVLFENSRDAVLIADETGRCLECNPATVAMFGLADKQVLLERGLLTLFPATQPDGRDSREVFRERVADVLKGASGFFEVLHQRADGTPFPAEVSVSLVEIQGRRLLHGLMRDISERRQAETELRQAKAAAESASRAKSEFLANTSHEIRTPMSAILGYSELLESPDLSEDERREYLAIIQRNGQALLQLINDILDLSKIEAGRMQVERVVCTPRAIVDEAVSLLRVRAEEKGLSLTVECREPLPANIHTDPVRLRQILVNLVGNAIKFTATGGVRISLACLADPPVQLHLAVEDTGIGIEPATLPKLFQPFVQADSSHTRRYGGSGLGLVICDRLAGLLGGRLTVTSTPGLGSTFTLVLDLAPADLALFAELEPAMAPGLSRAARSQSGQFQGRILLAEDAVDTQRLLQLTLRRVGVEVDIAENGLLACHMALASLAQLRPYDLILMDVQMPELNGLDAAARLRNLAWVRPIVAITAHAMAGDRERCLAAGCDDYLTKPVAQQNLLETLARYLPSRETAQAAG